MMFSDDDIEEIIRILPSEKVFPSNFELPDNRRLPPLLSLASSQGLLTQQQALRALEDAVTADSRRISIASLSQTLGIDERYIHTFVETSPHALFSQDRTSIISRPAINQLHNELRTLSEMGAVSKSDFAADHDIEDLDSLIRIARGKDHSEDDFLQEEEHLFSQGYQKEVEDAIEMALRQASADATAVNLSSNMLPGLPPLWFVGLTLDKVIHNSSSQSLWRLETTSTMIRCTPKDAVERQSKAEIDRLKNGDLAFIDLNAFSSTYSSLYPKVEDAIELLAPETDIEVRDHFAFSRPWFSNIARNLLNQLQAEGYVDLIAPVSVYSQIPGLDYAVEILERSLRDIWAIQSETSNTHSDDAICRAGNFIVTPTRYDHERIALLSLSRTHANEEWKLFQDSTSKETILKFEGLPGTRTDAPLSHALLADVEIQKAVEEQFWDEVSRLEAENEASFSTFWTDRVAFRVRVYVTGLEIIQDAKLKDQLSELLATYIQKELLPESISKARTQGLVCSRKTKKNLQRFETISKSSKKGASELVTTIERFIKKQGMAEPDNDSLAEVKTRLVEDMARKMQKQSEGPILFLTLVIILLARRQSGVVYATGKFAPKLLKQLKMSLAAEQFEQLELWKEGAKSNTLTPEDKTAMKQMASNL